MKTHRILLLTALMALPGLLPAQTVTSGVPGFISYQGRVLDSTGAPVGTGTPVNRKVIFRVWDHPSNVLAANLIYSEEQTVTIADGKFSVLVGQGIGTTVEQFSFNETEYGPNATPAKSIANAFNGSGRYLGVTVDDGTAAVDNEIAPRQQVVTSAFAFRSKFAETLGTSTASTPSLTVVDGGNIGVGNTNPPALFTISGANTSTSTSNTQLVVTADDITERLRIGVDSTGNGTSFLQSWKEGTGPGTGATNLLLNPNGGNVGIGTKTPNGALDVEGYVRIQTGANDKGLLAFGNRGTGANYYDNGVYRGAVGSLANGNYLNLGSYAGIAFNTSAAALGAQPTRMFIDGGSGNVGIGTSTPTQAKLVVVGTATDNIGSHYAYGTAGPINSTGFSGPVVGVSIKASDAIHASIFRAVSDARIKVIEGVSDREKDLEMLSRIEITNYTHKDVIGKGKAKQKKVIAQQVETVFPEAVMKTVDVVPDIYQSAKIVDGWIELPTDLKKGERVRLIVEKHDEIHEVLEVKKDRFLTAYRPDPEKDQSAIEADRIFVFGREVKDFRVVDYEAISMLNVSATQELAKRVEAVTKENAELRAKLAASEERLAEMSATDKVFEAKLTALEQRLQGSDKPALRTVSLQGE